MGSLQSFCGNMPMFAPDYDGYGTLVLLNSKIITFFSLSWKRISLITTSLPASYLERASNSDACYLHLSFDTVTTLYYCKHGLSL